MAHHLARIVRISCREVAHPDGLLQAGEHQDRLPEEGLQEDGRRFLHFLHEYKFYYDDNVWVKIFIISEGGSWYVGPDITLASGAMKSEKKGLMTPPRTGWEYADGTWLSDETLEFRF